MVQKLIRVGSMLTLVVLISVVFALAGGMPADLELNDDTIEEIVRRSYPYVALFNLKSKFAMKAGGWNRVDRVTELYDHNVRAIARPNNDTLYVGAMLDLRNDAVIMDIPVFDSEYISLMAVAYDHYVQVPMTTRLGDFQKPVKVLFYSARTRGYAGEPVSGVDRIVEVTGDFISAVLRIMPHASEPERFKRIAARMKSVRLLTLSEYRGGATKAIEDVAFPAFGKTDADIFENNLLEVMQFVFNHTTFDPLDKMDQALLSLYKPLGVVPGKTFETSMVDRIDGGRFAAIARDVQRRTLGLLKDPGTAARLAPRLFRVKGQMDLDTMVAQSVIGPMGLPMDEAMYPNLASADGRPLNAMNDYVIRMTKDQLPPAGAFWSLTLYDLRNGFFIPNHRKKYSVGKNAGMQLNADGGIEIYIAAEKPDGVPEENWLPINRKGEGLSLIMRIYVPDLDKMKRWAAPKAERL